MGIKENKNYATPSPDDYEFRKVYTEEKTGIIHTWYFKKGQLNKGPFRVEIEYPEDFKSEEEVNENLPITQQRFLNPANNKMVGYGRAVQLGIYKPESSGDGRGRPKK